MLDIYISCVFSLELWRRWLDIVCICLVWVVVVVLVYFSNICFCLVSTQDRLSSHLSVSYLLFFCLASSSHTLCPFSVVYGCERKIWGKKGEKWENTNGKLSKYFASVLLIPDGASQFEISGLRISYIWTIVCHFSYLQLVFALQGCM